MRLKTHVKNENGEAWLMNCLPVLVFSKRAAIFGTVRRLFGYRLAFALSCFGAS